MEVLQRVNSKNIPFMLFFFLAKKEPVFILEIKIELQKKETHDYNLSDINENLRRYEPDSEEIHLLFSKLGEISISKAFPLLMPLAPILTTLLKLILQVRNKMIPLSFSNCYSVVAFCKKFIQE